MGAVRARQAYETFERGLDIVLDGIEVYLERRGD